MRLSGGITPLAPRTLVQSGSHSAVLTALRAPGSQKLHDLLCAEFLAVEPPNLCTPRRHRGPGKMCLPF